MQRSLYFYEKNSPRFYFVRIFVLPTENRKWIAVQSSSTSFLLIWSNLVNYSTKVYNKA